jgi:dihydrofolate synthase/folylpolyglutamate synthase
VTTYASSLASLKTLQPLGIRPGLDRIRALLKALGHPERGMRVIHVAGSNGKGSVCRMIESVLIESGYRTGMFISPHLVDFRERFRISGAMASKAEIAAAYPILQRALKRPEVLRHGPPTFFEAVTALAFLVFKRRGCEILVLETGLGGRFDSTNVIPKPLLTLITNISLEHTQILGKTEAKIAWEKAGIIKKGSPLVTAAQGRALQVILSEFRRKQGPRGKAACVALKEGANWRALSVRQHLGSAPGQSLEMALLGRTYWLFIPLLGAHQRTNLACALAGLEMLRSKLGIHEEALARGLAGADWMGRLQVIRRNPLTLVDGAHNPAGAKALASALQGFGAKRVLVVAGVLRDKDWRRMFRELNKAASRYFLARPADDRGLDASEIALHLKGQGWGSSRVGVYPSPAAALAAARQAAKKGDLIAVCGSLYTVGAILG